MQEIRKVVEALELDSEKHKNDPYLKTYASDVEDRIIEIERNLINLFTRLINSLTSSIKESELIAF